MNPISVLLVDDNPTFLRTATRFLQEHDDVVGVGTAGGGEEILAQAQGLQPDIVLTNTLKNFRHPLSLSKGGGNHG